MDDRDIRAGLLAALCEVAPEVEPAQIDPTRPLRAQVDLDSMDWLNVIIGWHRRFGIEIPEADYARLTTLDAAARYVGERRRAQSADVAATGELAPAPAASPAADEAALRAGVAPRDGDTLLVVDVQRDFLPGGRLAVPGGDAVIAPVNACIRRFVALGLPVFASRDWHPYRHCSFQEAGGPWPPHAVAGTRGAAFAEALQLPTDALIVSKGSAVDRDAYSAFSGTDLHAQLRARRVLRLFVVGLATDYCVLDSVLDALKLGYRVVVVSDAIAAVDVQPGDGARALQRMRAAGAVFATNQALG